jgi:hypothetical protein
MPSDQAPALSAIYHLALALHRSGGVSAIELIEAAQRVEREGARDEPENELWDQFAHALRLAAVDIEDDLNRPSLNLIEGGKPD